MVRYSSEHKGATRRRIIERAGRRFKRDGVDGAGISTLMGDAELTNGAFYAHFASKADLVAAVLEDQLRTQRESSGAQGFDRAGFERFVDRYLSMPHRDDREGGCPTAALLGDVIRSDDEVRRAYAASSMPLVDDIAALLPGPDARARAAAIFAAMAGTLQLARVVDDPGLAAAILRSGTANVMLLVDSPPRGG